MVDKLESFLFNRERLQQELGLQESDQKIMDAITGELAPNFVLKITQEKLDSLKEQVRKIREATEQVTSELEAFKTTLRDNMKKKEELRLTPEQTQELDREGKITITDNKEAEKPETGGKDTAVETPTDKADWERQKALISGIDPAKEVAEQNDNVNALKGCIAEACLPVILGQEGFKKEDIDTFEKFVNYLNTNKEKFKDNEVVSFLIDKILIINSTENSPVKKDLEANWTTILETSKESIGLLASLQEALKDPSKYHEIIEQIKKHPIFFAAIGLGGSALAYNMIGSLFNGGEKRGSTTSGLVKFGGLILSIFGLGKTLGNEKVKEFFKTNFNIDFDENRITRFMKGLREGKLEDAMTAMVDSYGKLEDSKYKQFAESNEKLNDMNPKILKYFGGKKIKELKEGNLFSIASVAFMKDEGVWGLYDLYSGESKIKEFATEVVANNPEKGEKSLDDYISESQTSTTTA